jgi:predicted ATP-dependent endonuclease of OLD family
MRLKTIRISNYRCFKDETINFDNYTSFVGPNGSGKSTVLMALNVFFRNTQAPSDVVSLVEEDFHHSRTEEPVEIICTFTNLSDEAKEDLKAYVRQGELIVKSKAVWDAESRIAKVQQYGVRNVIEDFAPYFEADKSGDSAANLKKVFQDIREKYPDVAHATTKADMAAALRAYEEEHPEFATPVDSSDQFYGWSKGKNLLDKYVQWIYLPAVKDASEEQDESKNTALGTLLQRTIRSEVDFSEELEKIRQDAVQRYNAVLEERNSALKDVEQKIQTSLRSWAHPGSRVKLTWHQEEQKSVNVASPFARANVGEGEFLGELVRSGHGMQRSFLVAMLEVLARSTDSTNPTLLLGFEEPELYQHPPQARHLASLIQGLAQQDGQVVITTHSPYFVSPRGYEDIRLVREAPSGSGSATYQLTYDLLNRRIADALGEQPRTPTELVAALETIMEPSQAELFFCRIPVLVEGPEDVAFLSTYLTRHNRWNEFRKQGCHLVVCSGKTDMSRPLAIAQGLGMRPFVIFDGDCYNDSGDVKEQERRPNRCLLNLLGSESEAIIAEPHYASDHVMWPRTILHTVRDTIGKDTWDAAEEHCRQTYGLRAGVKSKNPTMVAATVEKLLNDGHELTPLSKAVTNLMAFVKENAVAG